MNKSLPILIAVAMLFLTACVTTGKYQLKVDEANRWLLELQTMRKNLSDCSDALKNTQSALDSLNNLVQNLNGHIQTLKATISDDAQNITTLKNALEATASQKDSIIIALTNAKESAESRIRQLDEEAYHLRYEKEHLQQALTELNQRFQQLSQQYQDNQNQLQTLQAANQQLQNEIDQLSLEKNAAIEKLKVAYNDLVKNLQQEIQNGQIQITRLQDKLSVKILEKIMFESGQAEITPEGEALLARLAPILSQLENQQIRIEGHTDNVRIGKDLKSIYPTNWELSTARATNVVRYLIEKLNLDPKRISATGYAEYHPVASNRTAAGRAQNRRIEIVVAPIDIDRVVSKPTE